MTQTLNTDFKRQAENNLFHECLLICFSPGTFSEFQVSSRVRQVSLPDDGDELRHGELVRHQELGFVQRGEIFLPVVALDDDLRATGPGQSSRYRLPAAAGTGSPLRPLTYRDLVGELGADSRYLLLPGGWMKNKKIT